VDRSDDVADEIIDALAAICLRLPEVRQERAWLGTRWRVRNRTFAHVLPVAPGRPAAYAEAAGARAPITVLTFRLPTPELDALAAQGHPYFHARWGRQVAGLVIEDRVDWVEVAEHLTESYCLLAPQKLAALVDRPPPDG
jgi:hypothetical protein